MRLEGSLIIAFCAFKLIYLLTNFEGWYRKSIKKREWQAHRAQRAGSSASGSKFWMLQYWACICAKQTQSLTQALATNILISI